MQQESATLREPQKTDVIFYVLQVEQEVVLETICQIPLEASP